MAKLRMAARTLELAERPAGRLRDDYRFVDFADCPLTAAAELMVAAYRGTTDWEDGDDADVAQHELQNVLSGHYGEFLPGASRAGLSSTGALVSTIVCALEDQTPLILFLYTDPAHKRRGLASALIAQCAAALHQSGYEQVALYVSEDNPARGLYQQLGFAAE